MFGLRRPKIAKPSRVRCRAVSEKSFHDFFSGRCICLDIARCPSLAVGAANSAGYRSRQFQSLHRTQQQFYEPRY